MATRVPRIDDEIRDLREKLDLTQEQLAQVLGVTARTVSRWEHGAIPQPLARRAIQRWQKVLDRLQDVFGADDLRAWFHAPNDTLGGRTPFEAATTSDGAEVILDLIDRAEWGIPA